MSIQLIILYNIAITLVQPQIGKNIGVTARSPMANFSLNDLRIIKPRDGWPNEQVKNISVGAL